MTGPTNKGMKIKPFPSFHSEPTRPVLDVHLQPLSTEALAVFLQLHRVNISTLSLPLPWPSGIACWKAFYPAITFLGSHPLNYPLTYPQQTPGLWAWAVSPSVWMDSPSVCWASSSTLELTLYSKVLDFLMESSLPGWEKESQKRKTVKN